MSAIEKTISRTQRRLAAVRTVQHLAWWAFAALGAALLLVLAERLLLLSVPEWLYAVLAAGAVAAAGLTAWASLPTREATANLLDERLRLKDRLGSALYARSLNQPLASQVVADGERAAGAAAVSHAVPLAAGSGWRWVPVMGAALLVAVVFVPGDADLLGWAQDEDDRQQQTAEQQSDDEAEQQLGQQVQQEDEQAADQAADPQDILAELASLSDRDLRHPELRDRAAEDLERLQQELASYREQTEQQLQTIHNAMSGLETDRGPADEMVDAMRRGDMAEAAEAVQELAQAMQQGDLSEQEQQELEQQLSQLEHQLEQMRDQAQQEQEQIEQELRDQLREAGLDERQIDELAEQDYDQQATRDALEEQLQDQGMDEQQAAEQAEQMSQDMEQARQQRDQQQELAECAGGLCDSIGNMRQAAQQGQEGEQGADDDNGQQSEDGQDGGASFAEHAWDTQQRMSELAQAHEQLRRMSEAESEAQDALHEQYDTAQAEGGDDQDTSDEAAGAQQMAQQQNQTGAGTAPGGDPLGEMREIEDRDSEAADDSGDAQGRPIASWAGDGQSEQGEARLQFDQAVREARSDAERAVNEDRVPRRYHGPIRDYFEQLPEPAEAPD